MTRSDLTEQQNKDYVEKIADLITAEPGEISRKEYWGLKVLAYRIGKNRRAHYSLFNYSAPPTLGEKLLKIFNIDEELVRYMIMRTKTLPTEISLMMKPDAEEESEDTDLKVVRRRERQGPSTWKPGEAADDTRSRLTERAPPSKRRNYDDKYQGHNKSDSDKYNKGSDSNTNKPSKPTYKAEAKPVASEIKD